LLRRFVAGSCAAVVFVAGGVLTPALAAHPHQSVSFNAAGSSFAAPFFTKAFEAYQAQKGVAVNYQAIGSGAGIRALIAKTVDFAASDVPMNPTTELVQAEAAGGPVVQIPGTLGGVSIAFNLPSVKTGALHLTGPVLADIYLGRIKTWDDKAIKKLNKKVNLPSQQIIVVHRSDSSGTSYIFTDYLARVSDTWRGVVGVGKLPNWPTGIGGPQNPGVAQLVQSTPYTIGYVELAYVLQNHMKQAALLNRLGQYLTPSLTTIAADAAQFPKLDPTRNFSIVNGKGKQSYPICGYTWVIVYKKFPDSSKSKALKGLLNWLITTGQKYAKSIQYVPLPANIQKFDTIQLKTVK
jgi:phosphate transport system substrate-binding protein